MRRESATVRSILRQDGFSEWRIGDTCRLPPQQRPGATMSELLRAVPEGGIAWLNDSQTELRCQTSPRCAECSRERLAHLFYKTNRERCSAADTGPAVAWVRGWKHRVNGHGHIAIAHNGQRRKAAIMREEVGTTAEDVAILSDVRINGCRSIHHRRQPQPYVSRKLWRTERSHGQAASVVPDTILLPLPAFFSP